MTRVTARTFPCHTAFRRDAMRCGAIFIIIEMWQSEFFLMSSSCA